MTSGADYSFHFTNQPRRWPVLDGTWLSGDNFRGDWRQLLQAFGAAPKPPAWAQDLLRLAQVVYLVDRCAPREAAPDGWTRNISVTIELIDPDPWDAHLGLVTALLSTLTSDRWKIQVTDGAAPLPAQPPMVSDPVTEVALFSGGLDSLAYAARRAREGANGLLLVAQYDSNRKQQRRLYGVISTINPSVRLCQFWHDVQASSLPGNRRKQEWEPSTRSRGLLFAAAAIHTAAAHGVATVMIPENGQLAVNPPLMANRVGACSSRSVHPRTLDLLNQLIRAVAGTGAPVEVTNPQLTMTKADVCRRALRAGLGAGELATAESCGHPPQRRGNGPAHCGYCFPCLIRRAALWDVLGGADPTVYQADPWEPGATREKRADFLALRHWLAADFGVRDLVADIPLPANAPIATLLDVIRRGRAELKAFFDSLPKQN